MSKKVLNFLIFLSCLNNFTKALNVDCSFEQVDWEIFTTYTCRIRSSQISSNDSSLLGFTGTHANDTMKANGLQPKFTNMEVKGFFMDQNCHHVTEIPTNINQFFPNFVGISINACGIKTLKGDELKNYQNLQAFFLEGTKVEKIPGNLFSQNPYIRGVTFKNNQIAIIGENLFGPHQTSLSFLNFIENKCINMIGRSEIEIPPIVYQIKFSCKDTKQEEINGIKTNSTLENNSLKDNNGTVLDGKQNDKSPPNLSAKGAANENSNPNVEGPQNLTKPKVDSKNGTNPN